MYVITRMFMWRFQIDGDGQPHGGIEIPVCGPSWQQSAHLRWSLRLGMSSARLGLAGAWSSPDF